MFLSLPKMAGVLTDLRPCDLWKMHTNEVSELTRGKRRRSIEDGTPSALEKVRPLLTENPGVALVRGVDFAPPEVPDVKPEVHGDG